MLYMLRVVLVWLPSVARLCLPIPGLSFHGLLVRCQIVEVRISYVSEVSLEGKNLRFTLPTAVAPRYHLTAPATPVTTILNNLNDVVDRSAPPPPSTSSAPLAVPFPLPTMPVPAPVPTPVVPTPSSVLMPLGRQVVQRERGWEQGVGQTTDLVFDNGHLSRL